MDEKNFFVHFFMQSNGLYIRVIDERLFKTTKEVTALTRDIDYCRFVNHIGHYY